MSEFTLRRFEIEGLNCSIENFPLTRRQPARCRLSDAISEIAERDERFWFELAGEGPDRMLARLVWSEPWIDAANPCRLRRAVQYYELGARQTGQTRTVFRYTILDPFGQMVESDLELKRPIFSKNGPWVENGFAVKLELISLSLPHSGQSPLLARLPHRRISWIADSGLILDL